ncbi:MAG: hypothetical protein MK105_07365 [Crocinitomicaceae bacterium]|nr:hypothetical protein [Crocinitomicaceae bacterium]
MSSIGQVDRLVVQNKIYLVGEDHTNNNACSRLAIIESCLSTFDTINIGLEISKSYEVEIKSYLNQFDPALPKRLKSIDIKNRKDFYSFVVGLRKIANSHKTVINVNCFDVENVFDIHSTEALIRFCESFKGLKNTKLWRLVNQYVDKENIVSHFDQIILECNRNPFYKKALGAEWDNLLLVIDGSLISAKNAKNTIKNARYMDEREEFMSKCLLRKLQFPLIVFSGENHVSKFDKEFWGTQKTLYNLLIAGSKTIPHSILALFPSKKILKKIPNKKFDYIDLVNDEMFNRFDSVLIVNGVASEFIYIDN